MNKKTIIFLVTALIFELLISCSHDDPDENDCISTNIEYVTSVNSPATGKINEIINIEVNFQVFNGCGEFGKFIKSQNGNTRTIEVEAKYSGCFCTQDLPIRMTNYKFTASNAGEYKLNFKSSPTEFITVNITIN